MKLPKVIDDNLVILIALGVGLVAISFLNRKKSPKRTKEQVKTGLCEFQYDMAHPQIYLMDQTFSRDMSERDKKYKKTWLNNCMKTHIVSSSPDGHGWVMKKIVS